jgi:N-acetylglucosamine transport system substrate-binding protein
MSETPEKSNLSRRNVLRGAAAAGLLAVPTAGLLAACGNDSKDGGSSGSLDPTKVKDGSSVDVVVFNGGLGDEYPKFDNTLFAAKHPKVKVNLRSTQKIKTEEQPKFSKTPADLINNSGADLIALDALINFDAITDMTTLLDAPSWDDPNVKVRDTLVPGTVADGTTDGKFYVLNYAYTVFGMWYNKVLFDKNGWTPPTTFDEFFTLAPKMKAANVAPFAFAGKYPYYMRWAIMSWIWKSGGKQAVVDIDNLKAGAWKAGGVMTALQAVEKMVKDGFTLPGSDTLSHTESQQALLDDRAGLLPCGTWLENEMKATTPAGYQLTCANFWDVGSGDVAKGAVFAGSGEGWIVPRRAANPAGGMEFLRAMLSKEGSAKFASLTHSLASVKGSGDKVTDSTALKSANAVLAAAQGDLVSFKFPDWYGALDTGSQNAIGELMAGRMTADQFASTMEDAAQKVAGDSTIVKHTRT